MDLSIAVISYNTRDWLRRSLTSIHRDTRDITFDVFVADNASIDGSAEMVRKEFPHVRLVANPTNLYITKPYNEISRKSTGRYILICDSDLEYPDNVLGRMVQFLDAHKDIGILCAAIRGLDQTIDPVYNRDNTLEHAFFTRTFLAKLFRGRARALEARFMYAGWVRRSSQDIEVADVCLMVRREVFEQAGYYDETYKLYFPQNDLCLRARAKGWRIHCWADAAIVHAKSQSVGKTPFQTIAEIYRSDMRHFYRQQHGLLRASLFMGFYHATRLGLRFAQITGLYHPKKNMIYGIEGTPSRA